MTGGSRAAASTRCDRYRGGTTGGTKSAMFFFSRTDHNRSQMNQSIADESIARGRFECQGVCGVCACRIKCRIDGSTGGSSSTELTRKPANERVVPSAVRVSVERRTRHREPTATAAIAMPGGRRVSGVVRLERVTRCNCNGARACNVQQAGPTAVRADRGERYTSAAAAAATRHGRGRRFQAHNAAGGGGGVHSVR